MNLDFPAICNQFSILAREINGHSLTYLGNTASSQKPYVVTTLVRDWLDGQS